MGADSFTSYANGKTAQEAFESAVKEAQYDYGHAGYTGTIAEKKSFVMIPTPDTDDIEYFIEKMLDGNSSPVNDKWGPAGCIKLDGQEFVFFGWASS